MKNEIARFFWSASERGLEEIARSLGDPDHVRFVQNAVTLLSRSDDSKEAFRIFPRERFAQTWPRIRRGWRKSGGNPELLYWWDSIFDKLIQHEAPLPKKGMAEPATIG